MVGQGSGGSIINVTSQLAEVARPKRAAYVASKGGGRSLTQATALDLAPHSIRVNAIAPGLTLTGLTRASYAAPERRRATIAQILLGRLGDPQDLVVVLFLASDEYRRQHGDRRWQLRHSIIRSQRSERKGYAPPAHWSEPRCVHRRTARLPDLSANLCIDYSQKTGFLRGRTNYEIATWQGNRAVDLLQMHPRGSLSTMQSSRGGRSDR